MTAGLLMVNGAISAQPTTVKKNQKTNRAQANTLIQERFDLVSPKQKTQTALKMSPEELKVYIIKRLQALSLNKSPPEFTLSGLYDSFKFNSTNGALYNRYNGTSKLLNVGGANLAYRGYNMGLTLSLVDTNLASFSLFTVDSPSSNETDIHNTAINAHVMHSLFNRVNLDVLGGVGYSDFDISSTLNIPTVSAVNGSGNLHGLNEYIGARLHYARSYRLLSWRGDIGYVFNNFSQSEYTIAYNNATNTVVSALTTRIGFLTENAQLSYQVNNALSPFFSAGLIQVVSRFYSHPLTVVSTSSALPQITLGNNGYRLATGVVIHKNHIRITPYYQYSQRGSNYVDNMGMLKLDYLFY